MIEPGYNFRRDLGALWRDAIHYITGTHAGRANGQTEDTGTDVLSQACRNMAAAARGCGHAGSAAA